MDHSGHHSEPASGGMSICMVESREAENYSSLDRSLIANHVWETCKPGSNFTVKTPTVSARRVQLMRAQLQSDKLRECERDSAPEQLPKSKCGKTPARSDTCHCGAKATNKNNNGGSKLCKPDSSTSSVFDGPFKCEEDNSCDGEEDEEEGEEEDDCNY